MADESKEPKYLAVYHSDHDGEPLALIRTDLPGNHATEMVRALRLSGGEIYAAPTNATGLKRSEDIAAMFRAGDAPAEPGAAAPDPDEPGSTADPDAALRAEIRAQLETDERRKRVEAEVKREMADEKRADKDAPAKAKD